MKSLHLTLTPQAMFRIMLKVSLLCIIIIILNGYKSQSQENKFQIDSLLYLHDFGKNYYADSLLYDYAYKSYKTKGYKKGMARYLIRMGMIMINQKKYDEAFKFANRSEIIGAEIGDNSIVARAMIIKGRAFSALGFVGISKAILNEAKVYAEKIEDPNQRNFNLGGIHNAWAINLENSPHNDKTLDSIFFYAKLSYAEQKKVTLPGLKSGLAIACAYLGNSYIQTRQYDSARYYLNESLLNLEPNKYEVLAMRPYFQLGFLYYKNKSYESSIYNYNQALKIAINIGANVYRKDIYLALSNCYKEKGNEHRSKAFLKKYKELSKILNNKKINSAAVTTGHIENEKVHVIPEPSLLWGIIFFTVLFLGTVFLMLKLFYKEKISVWRKFPLREKEVEFLDEPFPKKQIDADELRSVVQMAISNDPAFLLKFRNLDGEFIDKLLQLAPNLVASELELCVQVRLNFETKEIARYTKQSVRSIQGKKHRVRKKLGIPVTEDFNVWMAKL
jgi:tetratricopeptide (TPR) repeat protein